MPPRRKKKVPTPASKEEVEEVENKIQQHDAQEVEILPPTVENVVEEIPSPEKEKSEEAVEESTVDDLVNNQEESNGPSLSSSSIDSKMTKQAAVSPEEFQSRLFQLRMKINQGRSANRSEAEEEFVRLKKGNGRKNRTSGEEGEDAPWTKQGDGTEELLNQTAQEAEWEATKARKKAETAATYGLNAFTSEAYYRAYEKRVKKLQTGRPTPSANSSAVIAASSSSSGSVLESNPLEYGKVNSKVSAAALQKLQADVVAREMDRRKFSKRRMATDASDVDYINDKNAGFNKKLRRAFDKYTVETRQNLERGTAI
eukprot:gene208-223_t